MKLSVAVCFLGCLICFACPCNVRAKSHGPNAQYIIEHVLGIVADGVMLAENDSDRDKTEESIGAGVSIVGHLGSIIAHIAQSHRQPGLKPMIVDELIALLTDNRELTEQIGQGLLRSKQAIRNAQGKNEQSIEVHVGSDL